MLYEALDHYAKKDVVPFHMPGHKRNTRLLGKDLPYAVDITEIDGFDNLQDPEGILKKVADRAAALFGTGKAFPHRQRRYRRHTGRRQKRCALR